MKPSRLSFQLLLLALGLSSGCGLFINSYHPVEDFKPIHAAAQGGDLAKVKSLVEHDRRLVEAKDWDNLRPLHLAVLHGHREVVLFLLENGATINAKTSAGITPLHYAAQTGNQDLVELLLAHGANSVAVDSKGWTPADRAEKWHYPAVADFLRHLAPVRKAPKFLGPKWLESSLSVMPASAYTRSTA